MQGPYASGQPKVGTPAQYSPPTGYRMTLIEVTKSLGVSIYKLAKMVGSPTFNVQPYQWLAGKHRPSSKYLNRMLLLVVLKKDYGWTIDKLSNIDWETFGNAKG